MSQQTYEESSSRPLLWGAVADSGTRDTISCVNSSPGAAQSDTITITNYVAGKTLTWTIDGVAFSYSMTVADADTTGVAHSVMTQMCAEPIFGGRFTATHLLGVITLVGRFAGTGWTLAATGTWAADFTVGIVTANATGAVLPYGRLAVSDGQSSTSKNLKCKLGSAANLTAKVVNATPAQIASATYRLGVTVNGITYWAENTAANPMVVKDCVEAIVAILNGVLPTQTVVATEDDTKVILTSELAGLSFDVVTGSGGATQVWTLTDTALASDDVNKAALGIALRSDSIETNSTTEPGYPANRVCSVLKKGRVVVQVPTTVVPTRGVWVRLANATATSPLGSFRDTTAADCVQLDPQRFRWHLSGSTSTRAILQVNAD